MEFLAFFCLLLLSSWATPGLAQPSFNNTTQIPTNDSTTTARPTTLISTTIKTTSLRQQTTNATTVAPTSKTDSCGAKTTCDTCVDNYKCYWCGPSKKCIKYPSNKITPDCAKNDWYWKQCTVPGELSGGSYDDQGKCASTQIEGASRHCARKQREERPGSHCLD